MGQFAGCHAALLCSSGSVQGQFRVCHVLVLDCHRVVRDGTASLRSRPVQFCSVRYSRRSVPDSFERSECRTCLILDRTGSIAGQFLCCSVQSSAASGQGRVHLRTVPDNAWTVPELTFPGIFWELKENTLRAWQGLAMPCIKDSAGIHSKSGFPFPI